MEIIETIFLRTLDHELIEQVLQTLNASRSRKPHKDLTAIRILRNADTDTDPAVFNHSIWKNG